ncbi:hypothetical protein POV27_14295 [Aureisphaera galaxeae]|uniref:hypothetical protein n=1 Tax=Aureisphaera galaxeae TaxID=1538023 RepID=UPI002350CEAF|nr:hypothetical protein [Aureisphaera galaxeae]MDC8005228.1 hypothetical protein [Aureisphaera galaxeae]
MRNAFFSYWNYGTTFCGAEVTTIDDHAQFYAATAKKKKGEFSEFNFLKGSSFGDLVSEMGKHRHAHLILNLDGVLIKETVLERDPQKAIGKAFPGLSLSDFYVDIHQGKDKMFVAVARKDVVEGLLKAAEEAGLGILSFQLGFGSLQRIAPLLSEETVVTGKYEFSLEQGKIVAFGNLTEASRNYRLEDISVPSEYLLSTSSLLGYLDAGEKSNEERNAALAKAYTEKNFFRKGLVAAVVLVLVSLLINFFFFTEYRKKFQNLSEQVEVASEQRKTLQTRTEAVEKKEYVVENILNSGHSKSSFYLNRVVSQRPESILFSNIQFQPLLKNVRPDKQILYDSDVLLLTGDSYDKEEFSSWIQGLEALSWVSNVTVLQYGLAKGSGNYFEIKLALLYDTAK